MTRPPSSWPASWRPGRLIRWPGGTLARQSLARIDQRGQVMHRLTRAILRDRLAPEQGAATRACTEVILAALP
jgi:hypothetical protein